MKTLQNTLSQLGIDVFVLVDVGAKGSIATIDGVEAISEIHAFEPQPEEFQLLEKKYQNHPFKQLKLNCIGLSNKVGKSTFLIPKNTSMSSLLEPDLINYKKHFGNYKAYSNWAANIETKKSIEINLNQLDAYFNAEKVIDYLKIDTQGSELTILKGAKKMLETGRIQVLKIEVSTIAVYQNQALFSDIDIFLRNYNYCLVDFLTYRETPSYLLGEDQDIHFAPCGDAIYCYLPDSIIQNNTIKKAVILNQLGYSSLAINSLEKTKLHKIQIDELIKKSSGHKFNPLKKIAKDVLPPIFIKLVKKMFF